LLARVLTELKFCDSLRPSPRPEGYVPPAASKLEAGRKSKPLSYRGPGVITLAIDVDSAKNETEALRSLVLVGTFDGAKKPQIWCPVGDFFGSAPGVHPYLSLPFTVAREKQGKGFIQLISKWWMPFEKSAVFEIHNLGKQPVTVTLLNF